MHDVDGEAAREMNRSKTSKYSLSSDSVRLKCSKCGEILCLEENRSFLLRVSLIYLYEL